MVNRVDALQDQTTEIDLVELFYMLLHNWKVLALAFVMGMVIMARMFNGVSEKDINTTIKTIMKIENNLKE